MGEPHRLEAATRLAAFRESLRISGLDGFILPRGDEHLGEYVAESSERLAWLTGFTGSAGIAIILTDEAVIFSDGRYTLQLEEQTDPSLWTRAHLIETPPEGWLATRLGEAGGVIGYDPWLMSRDRLERFARPGIDLRAISPNPVDALWLDRPAAPMQPALPQSLDHAGVASAEKRQQIAALLRATGEDVAVLTDPASIAWLLNLRGSDVPFTPLALGFALIRADETAVLFMDPRKISDQTRQWLGNAVQLEAPDALEPALEGLKGKTVRLDNSGSAVWFSQTLERAGATVRAGTDPCLLAKARKNSMEQAGAIAAHHRDGIALSRFLHWLDTDGRGHSEAEAASLLDKMRSASPLYRGESFPAISGSGPNGAIIHYRVTPQSDRTLRENEIYLIDSGGQYQDGTTDVTRTIWTGPGLPSDEVRDRYTRVLRGHIALARARFPAGTGGHRLDCLARAPLWEAGLDYDHGTGHGVGSYLSVHEGPCSIHGRGVTAPLEPGMILSNEPGYYLPGAYGMRIENLLLVQPAELPGTERMFLDFQILTLAPFDHRLIETAQLDAVERAWIDAYHARVLAQIGPELDPQAAGWLEAACAPLAA